MTQKIPYWHVDAFASQPFGGNQAAVMVLDAWPTRTSSPEVACDRSAASKPRRM